MRKTVEAALAESSKALVALRSNSIALDSIARAGDVLATSLQNGGRAFSCGNGGSMCDAMHFAEELSGRFRMNRRALPASSISDPAHLSCTANDFGYEQVFARYLDAHARAGDILLGITTSGNSANVILAAKRAREIGAQVIGLTGRAGSEMGKHCDVEICTPAGAFSDRSQELHIKVIHILIEIVERRLFPENYPD